jgi:hypothetical protein
MFLLNVPCQELLASKRLVAVQALMHDGEVRHQMTNRIAILEFRLAFEGTMLEKTHSGRLIAIPPVKPVYTFLIPKVIFERFS